MFHVDFVSLCLESNIIFGMICTRDECKLSNYLLSNVIVFRKFVLHAFLIYIFYTINIM